MASSEHPQKLEVTKEDIEEATRNALGPNAVVDRFESKTGGAGIGFLGAHFLIRVNGRESPGQPVVPLEMFAKMEQTDSDTCRGMLSFQTEGAFYEKLQLALRSAVESSDGKDVPEWCPKCYLVRENLIIVENMTASGYQSVGNWTEVHLTMAHYRQVARVLARFHAAGLVLAQKQGREAAVEVCPELKSDIFVSNDYNLAGANVRNAGADAIAAILPYMLENAPAGRLKELQEKVLEISRNLWKYLEEAKIGPLVPCHGDCHPNNYLFKFDEKGNPTEAVLIDFQLCRFNVPGLDLAFFLFVTSNQDFREKNRDELFRYYFDRLKEETAKHGLDLEKILTYEDLLAGVERVKTFAVFMALLYIGLLFPPKDDMIGIMTDPFEFQRFTLGARAGESVRWFKTVPVYRERTEQLLRILLDL